MHNKRNIKILELVYLNLAIIGHDCLRGNGPSYKTKGMPQSKSHEIQSKVQSSLKVQSSHDFQKWNTLTLGGAEVKYLTGSKRMNDADALTYILPKGNHRVYSEREIINSTFLDKII